MLVDNEDILTILTSTMGVWWSLIKLKYNEFIKSIMNDMRRYLWSITSHKTVFDIFKMSFLSLLVITTGVKAIVNCMNFKVLMRTGINNLMISLRKLIMQERDLHYEPLIYFNAALPIEELIIKEELYISYKEKQIIKKLIDKALLTDEILASEVYELVVNKVNDRVVKNDLISEIIKLKKQHEKRGIKIKFQDAYDSVRMNKSTIKEPQYKRDSYQVINS